MNNSDFSPKDRIDACDAQAKLAYDSWNDRRQYEWKFTLGVWTVLVLAVGFSRDVMVHGLLFLVFAVFVMCVYCIWLYGLWQSNEFDRQAQFHYQQQSREILCDPSHTIENFPYLTRKDREFRRKYIGLRKCFTHYSHLTYLLTTVLLLSVTFLFLNRKVASTTEERLKALEEATRRSAQATEVLTLRIEGLGNDIRTAPRASRNPPPRPRTKRN